MFSFPKEITVTKTAAVALNRLSDVDRSGKRRVAAHIETPAFCRCVRPRHQKRFRPLVTARTRASRLEKKKKAEHKLKYRRIYFPKQSNEALGECGCKSAHTLR